MLDDAPNDIPSRQPGSDIGWAFAVLAAVVVVIIVAWGWSGQGRGWGGNQVAHMMPPVDAGMNGPATRAWMPPRGR